MTDAFPANELYELLVDHLRPRNEEQYRSIFNLMGALTMEVEVRPSPHGAILPNDSYDKYIQYVDIAHGRFSITMNGCRIQHRYVRIGIPSAVVDLLKFADIEIISRGEETLVIFADEKDFSIGIPARTAAQKTLVLMFKHDGRFEMVEIDSTNTPEQVLAKLGDLVGYEGVRDIRRRYYHAKEQQLVSESMVSLAEQFPEEYYSEVLEWDRERNTPLVSRNSLAALAHQNIIDRGDFLQRR